MRFLPLASIFAISLIGCAAPSADESADSQENAYGSSGSSHARSRGSRAPLSGDELRFEKYLHVDASTQWWPSHSYVEYSAYVSDAAGKRLGVDAALYLESDRTFTLYYSEIVMADAYNGTARTQRKLTGTWRANGATLELGSASATTAMTQDSFSHDTEGLALSLPSGWAGDGVDVTVPLTLTSSNVGPTAPFWSDYR